MEKDKTYTRLTLDMEGLSLKRINELTELLGRSQASSIVSAVTIVWTLAQEAAEDQLVRLVRGGEIKEVAIGMSFERKTSKPDKKRLSVDTTLGTVGRVDDLRNFMEGETQVAIIREAVKYALMLIKHHKEGYRIEILRQDGTAYTFPLELVFW